jgi:fatty-acyl-CoA synthase
MDLSEHLAHRARWTPGKAALRFEDRVLSYADLERAVSAGTPWLRSQGVGAGDRVAFLGPNCPELIEVLYACARLGAICVPLNVRMPAAELRAFAEQARPRLLVAEQTFGDVAMAIAPEAAAIFRIGSDDLITAGRVPPDPERDPAAPVLVAFTSGTTGRPKGAVFTHQNLLLGALKAITDDALTAQDEVLAAVPLFHVAGLLSLTLPSLWAGATVTIHRQFDPGRVLADLQRHRVTRFMTTPVMTRALAAHSVWAAADLSSLTTVYTGSTGIRRPDVEPWWVKNVPIVQGYGMTEAPGIVVTPGGAPPEKALAGGKPALFQQVRVVDVTGHDMPAGQPGEIWTRGPTMMTGYWENTEANRNAFHGGWFRTGDVGVFDEDGYLRVVDRLKDVIVVGTSNVYPSDLEAVLADCPQVRDAAVIGGPDAELGEIPIACVVPADNAKLTAERVLALFPGRLAAYKQPRQVIFLESLPRNATGKVQKAMLRELARGGAGFSVKLP